MPDAKRIRFFLIFSLALSMSLTNPNSVGCAVTAACVGSVIVSDTAGVGALVIVTAVTCPSARIRIDVISPFSYCGLKLQRLPFVSVRKKSSRVDASDFHPSGAFPDTRLAISSFEKKSSGLGGVISI